MGMSEFIWPVRVYYEDTDSGGVVYYANYLKFMERSRTEWLRSLDFEQDELIAEHGTIFAVRSVQIDYKKPAHFNELLNVSTSIKQRGGASFTFLQQVKRGDEVLCEGEIKIASLDASTLRPRPIPAEMKRRLTEEGL